MKRSTLVVAGALGAVVLLIVAFTIFLAVTL